MGRSDLRYAEPNRPGDPLKVFEIEIENKARGFTLLQHVRADDELDAIARGSAHWKREILSVNFLRDCREGEEAEQRAKDLLPKPDAEDVKVVIP